MKYISKKSDIHITEPTAISLGKFDGLHTGHKMLVEEVVKKKKDGLKAVMFTFDIPPKAVVGRDALKVLTTNQEKVHIFEQTGIDYLIEYPFTTQVRNMKPEEFIRMLVKNFSVKCIVAGKDFHFGYERKGDYRTLQECCKKYGFEVIIVEKKQYEGRDVSSTFIREEILAGNLEKANMLLGYEFLLKGVVTHGKKLGRTQGVPTVNIIPPTEKLLPPFGVYVSRVIIAGNVYGGITNVGKKPTIEGTNPTGVETNIFDFDEDVYGKEIEIQFLSYLRKEKQFNSVDKLMEQIKKDIVYGKNYLRTYKSITL